MINKIDEMGIKVKVIIWSIFIIVSVIVAIYYSNSQTEKNPSRGTLAFWPPDMVPHPPHFPDSNPKPPVIHVG